MEQKNLIAAGPLQKYIAHLHLEERSPNTISKYKRDIVAFLSYLQQRPLNKEEVLSYKQCLLERGYLPSSINSMLAAINGFLGFIGRSECRVKQLRTQRKMFRDANKQISQTEYQKLVSAAGKTKQKLLQLILQTLGGTGIRISELQFVTVHALEEGVIRIANKGKIREVSIPHKLQRKLLSYCKKEKLSSGCIFTIRKGKSIHRSTVWRKMKALCKVSFIPSKKVFPHNLRHLFAHTFYQRSKNVVLLASILGHSSVETTRIYTASTAHEADRWINGLGLVL